MNKFHSMSAFFLWIWSLHVLIFISKELVQLTTSYRGRKAQVAASLLQACGLAVIKPISGCVDIDCSGLTITNLLQVVNRHDATWLSRLFMHRLDPSCFNSLQQVCKYQVAPSHRLRIHRCATRYTSPMISLSHGHFHTHFWQVHLFEFQYKCITGKCILPFYKRPGQKHNFICCLKCAGQLPFINICEPRQSCGKFF